MRVKVSVLCAGCAMRPSKEALELFRTQAINERLTHHQLSLVQRKRASA
jgi:hypothetical protein